MEVLSDHHIGGVNSVLELCPELLARVDLDVEQLLDVHLGGDTAGCAGDTGDDTDSELLTEVAHDVLIADLHGVETEFVSDVLLSVSDLQVLVELHPGDEVTSSADSTHSGGHHVSDVHSDGVAHSDLYTVDFSDFDHSLGAPGNGVHRGSLEHRDSSDTHSEVTVDRNVSDLDALLDEVNGTGHVPGKTLRGVGVADGTVGVGSSHLAHLDHLVVVHSGNGVALVLDGSVDTHDVLSGHSGVDVGVGVLGPDLLDSHEVSDEVGVSSGGAGVEVETVRHGLHQLVTDVEHVVGEVLGSLLGLFHSLVDPELPHEVCRVTVGTVGSVVKTHVGHESVQVGRDDLLLDLLHSLLLHRDDGLDGLDGVVGVGEFENVHSEGALVQESALAPSDVDTVSGVSVVAGGGQLSDVDVDGDFVSGGDGHEPVGVADDVQKLLEIVVGQSRDGGHICRIGSSFLKVSLDLLLGHGDAFSITHPYEVFVSSHVNHSEAMALALLVVSEADSP